VNALAVARDMVGADVVGSLRNAVR
jgi:hypothetical protein